ncbi:MAG: hypothetical protein A3I76_07180 [Elusimicrobia bacterium RIFCSPLOWO2_02_FULL_61_11]|nr:MAG: hypothetical protein A3I76_07180 [Elusimicrobia bacterium RIFCSPLOWO2_02_FULL_61_11]
MKKKIVFIIPPIEEKLWTFSNDLQYLGAAGLAALLLKDGHEVSVIDCAVDCRSVRELKKRLLALKPDIAAVPAIYGTLGNSYKIARAVKDSSGGLVVFGGLPATFSAERVLAECPQADICVINEGEISMSALAAGKPPAEIPGLAFRKDGKFFTTGPGLRVENLDELPLPARHLFPAEKYHGISLYTATKQRSTNLETKRGCPFSCEFCLQAPKEGGRYRLRSPAKVIEEMIQIRRDFPFIARIMIVDNDFLSPYTHGMEIIDGILKNDLHKQFEFMIATRVQSFLKGGDELIAKFDAANIRLVYFGMESVNKKNRDRLQKIKEEYDPPALFERMRAKGVHSVGSYIFGFENEDESDMLETVAASLHDSPSMVKYNILTPYPGTKFYDQYASKGKLRAGVPLWHYDNSHQTMDHTVDCRKFFRSAYRRFYFRPDLLTRIEWSTAFSRRKGVFLMTFAHHLVIRELLGFARDAYRFIKFGIFKSEDFVG